MRRTLAIAGQTVRAAVRSRVVFSVAGLLAVVMLLLAAGVRGDGTSTGRLTLVVEYSLGIASAILVAATLWMSCGTMAEDISERHIQMVAVKPVRRSTIWLGKWLGILAVDAILLGIVGGILTASVAFFVRAAGPDARRDMDATVLTARRRVAPEPPVTPAEIDAAFREATDGVPGAATAENRRHIARQLGIRRSVVPAGGSREWTFALPAPVRESLRGASCVQYAFQSTAGNRNFVQGLWTVKGDRSVEVRMNRRIDGTYMFAVPNGVLASAGEVTLQFQNDPAGESSTLVFLPEQMALLIPAGTFAGNAVRALMVIWCQLALVAALGVTAGTVFSFPVAAFVASSCVLICLSTHYFSLSSGMPVHSHGEESEGPSAYSRAIERVAAGMDVIVAPAVEAGPAGPLAQGILVSWRRVMKAAGLLGVVYPAALFAAGAALLNRRELALPGRT